MINLDYETWKETLLGVFKAFSKNPYLQLVPFCQLSQNDKKFLLSEDFYNTWIKTGAFVYHSDTWNISNSYILKNDGTYRKATNVSPIFFLFVSAFTKHISKYYFSNCQNRKISTFYAGEITQNRFNYKKDYNDYCKEINNSSQCYTYFIKLDIKNFFTSINIDVLFEQINSNVNAKEINIRNRDLLYYKELLKCLGKGVFPIICNSTALSYLATKIYLDNFDICLYDYLEKLDYIQDFEFIRYVDDLYILFDVQNERAFEKVVKLITNKANSELLKLGLQLNVEKIIYNYCPKISETLANSLYDDIVNGIEFSIDDYCSEENLINFIDNLHKLTEQQIVNYKHYNNLVNDAFSIDDLTKSANEVFNTLLYQDSKILQSINVVKKLNQVLSNDNQILKLDPAKLTLLILNTKNENLIKNMLNRLFDNDKKNLFDVYDLHIALTYLIKRSFRHKDLLNLIKKYDYTTYKHIIEFCTKSFVNKYADSDNLKNKFVKNIFHKKDKGKLYYLYSFYKIRTLENNYLEAFAYYKNYFDRMTAHFDAKIISRSNLNINAFYSERSLQNFYNHKYDEIIGRAHNIRNDNPLSHASANLLDNNDSIVQIKEVREQLSYIIKEKIESINN